MLFWHEVDIHLNSIRPSLYVTKVAAHHQKLQANDLKIIHRCSYVCDHDIETLKKRVQNSHAKTILLCHLTIVFRLKVVKPKFSSSSSSSFKVKNINIEVLSSLPLALSLSLSLSLYMCICATPIATPIATFQVSKVLKNFMQNG